MGQKKRLAKIIHFRPIFCVFIALLFGILAGRKLFTGDTLYIVVVAISFLCLIVGCSFYKKWVPIILILISFFVGTGFYYAGEAMFKGKTYEGERNVVARVTDDIYENEYYYNIVLDDCFIDGEGAKGIKLSVSKDIDIEITPGDILSFNSRIYKVNLFTLNHFNSFYLRDRTAYTATINASNLNLVNGNLKLDEKIRESLKNLLSTNMSEDSANIAFAVLTGDKTDLSEEVKLYYRGAGIFHILSVSGLHISILAGAIAWLLKKLKVNKYVNLGILFFSLLLYCYICGWTPSVVRATIMSMVYLIAKLSGKEYDSLTSLSIAGILLILIQPLNVFDIGFQMSFASVFAVFLLSRPIANIFKKFMPKYFAEALSVSISASIGIAPFLIMLQEKINILSIFANIFVLPLFEIVFILTAICVLLAWIPYFGFILKPVDWSFQGITKIAKIFNETVLKFSIENMDIFIVLSLILIIFSLSYFFMVSKKFKFLCASAIICILSVYGLTTNIVSQNINSSVSCITVYGQSNFLITNSAGESIFLGNDFYDENIKYLKQINKRKIDYFVATDVGGGNDTNFFYGYKQYAGRELISYKEFTYSNNEEIKESNCDYMLGNFTLQYV